MHTQAMLQLQHELESQLAGDPGNINLLQQLAQVLVELKQQQAALAIYQRLFDLLPDNPLVHYNVGCAHLSFNNLDLALTEFKTALAQMPDFKEAKNNLGLCLERKGELAEAEAIYTQLTAECPDFIDALYSLGSLKLKQRELNTANDLFQKIIDIAPAHHQAHNNIANILALQARQQQAIAYLQEKISQYPTEPCYRLTLLQLLYNLKDYDRLKQLAREHINLLPDSAWGHYYLALFFSAGKYYQEAHLAIVKAYELEPASQTIIIELLYSIIRTANYLELYTLTSSAHWLEQQSADVLLQVAFVASTICDFDLKQRALAAFKVLDDDGLTAFPPFMYITQFHDNAGCMQFAIDYTAQLCAGITPIAAAPHSNKVLKIGYISSDLNEHAVGLLVKNMLCTHSDEIHVTAYSIGYFEDAVTAEIKQGVNQFKACAHHDDISIAQEIYNDKIDILIDLNGHSKNARTAILAQRPAPIQMQAIGYYGTMGAEFMDCFLTTAVTVPHNLSQYFVEDLAYLPETDVTISLPQQVRASQSKAELGAEHCFLFACFNHLYRLCSNTMQAWSAILHQVKNSKLLLQYQHRAQIPYILQAFAQYQITEKQLILIEQQNLTTHWLNKSVDLILDTFTLSGGTANILHCWAGTPYITLATDALQTRLGLKTLHAVGLNELCTTNVEDYIDLAVALANAPETIAMYQQKLIDARNTRAIFNPTLFSQQLEQVLQDIYHKGKCQ